MTNDGTSGLIVNVVVSSSVLEVVVGSNDRRAVLGPNSARQRILRRFVTDLQSSLEISIFVDADSENRTEDLLDHGLVVGVRSRDESGLNKETLRLVALSSKFNLGNARVLSLDVINVLLALLERSFVNDGVNEDGRILGVSHLNVLHSSLHALQYVGPDRLGNVSTRSGRALLSGELEGSTNKRSGQSLNMSAVMSENEAYQ